MASTNRSARAAAINEMKAQEADPMAALSGVFSLDQAAEPGAVPAAPGSNPWSDQWEKTKGRYESLKRLFGGGGG